jgi:hypothetical protein
MSVLSKLGPARKNNQGLMYGEGYITQPFGPPTANRNTRGSAMAPPLASRKTIIQEFPWRNHKQSPPTSKSTRKQTNGIPKQPVRFTDSRA